MTAVYAALLRKASVDELQVTFGTELTTPIRFTFSCSNATPNHCPYTHDDPPQLLSSAVEALANDVHDMLRPSLHLPARVAASDANASATPLKSTQQQQQRHHNTHHILQLPPRTLPLHESSAGEGGGGGAVAFKRRTVITHGGGIVTSVAGDGAAAAAVSQH